MALLPPGNILQNLFFKERIKALRPGKFLEIGSGNGHLSRILLDMGLTGAGYDLNASACDNNKEQNAQYITSGKYSVHNADALASDTTEKYDYIFSCMVIEHLDEQLLQRYFEFCKASLAPGGTIAVFVPSSMKYWGIEDEIAGHFLRYSFADLQKIASRHQLKIGTMSGLTYPLSNWLFRLSNHLVKKNEGYKQELSMDEKTVLSGNRDIKFKTTFPWYAGIILNDVSMYPFHLLQKMNARNQDSMVIYCEFGK